MLTVYVDAFKLAGPSASLKEGWDLISSQMDVGVPGGLGLYLGCKHEITKTTVDGNPVTVIEWNMEDYFSAIVKDYESLASDLLGKEVVLKTVATPFLEDDHKSSPARMAVPVSPSAIVCPWCRIPCTTAAAEIVFERCGREQEEAKAKGCPRYCGCPMWHGGYSR